MDPSTREPGGLRVLVAASDGSCARSLREQLLDLGFTVSVLEPHASVAVAAAVADEPDLCLLAADLPGSAVVAAARITAALPRTRVVILAAFIDEEDCLTYLLAGASGYLHRDIEPDRLGAALHAVVAGEAVIPASAKERLIEELRRDLL